MSNTFSMAVDFYLRQRGETESTERERDASNSPSSFIVAQDIWLTRNAVFIDLTD